MERNCLVSVIIPVYNVAPYLIEALDSVINQTYENLEILIIDDGSTDGSGEICDYYAEKDSRIRVIHQENKGLSAARNAGLDIMTGEVVAFLDPDDAFCADFISFLVFSMIRQRSEIVMCRYTIQITTGLLEYDGSRETYPKIDEGIYDRLSALRSIAEGTIDVHVWNKIYRRELWKNIRFPDGHVYEDAVAILGAFDICKSVYVLDQPLYAHRKRSGSITSIQSKSIARDRLLASSQMVSFIEDRTPEIFSLEQLEKKYESYLTEMIGTYILFSKRRDSEASSFSEELRDKIVAIRNNRRVRIEKYSLKTKTAFRIVCFCPSLMTVLYPLYHAIRVFLPQRL